MTDRAGALSADTVAELDAKLEDYERQTGRQVLVYVDRTTGDLPIEDLAERAFRAWRVGRRGIDDGAVLFLFTDDRRVRIEVGYGLEERLTDARAGRIIREQIAPRMRAGDADGALRSAVSAMLDAIGGGGAGSGGEKPPQVSGPVVIVTVVLLLIVIGLFVTHPTLALMLLMNIGSRGHRGGWGGGLGGGGFGGGGGAGRSGGGGFSGGGGRSGGGGASGSW